MAASRSPYLPCLYFHWSLEKQPDVCLLLEFLGPNMLKYGQAGLCRFLVLEFLTYAHFSVFVALSFIHHFTFLCYGTIEIRAEAKMRQRAPRIAGALGNVQVWGERASPS